MDWEDFCAFDFVDQMVFVLVPDNNNRPIYQFLNKTALSRLGKTREQVEWCPAHEVFDGRAAYSVYRRECAAWAGGVATQHEIALTLEAETIWAQTSLQPVFNEDGEMTHMVGTSRDITQERSQLYASVMSHAAVQEVEDLICLAAHDLRSPLCNLKTLAGVMRKNFVDHGDDNAELIDMVDSISDKALAVISGILAQAMAVGTSAGRTRFDLGDMCDDIMVMFDPTNMHSVSYPRVKIEAEFTVMQIALCNLFDNAFTYSGQDTAGVSVELTTMNAERLLCTVRDTGVGLEKAITETQDLGGADTYGLIGLGRLLRSRGGKLTLNTQGSGQGSEMLVELPGRMMVAAEQSQLDLRAG